MGTCHPHSRGRITAAPSSCQSAGGRTRLNARNRGAAESPKSVLPEYRLHFADRKSRLSQGASQLRETPDVPQLRGGPNATLIVGTDTHVGDPYQFRDVPDVFHHIC